MGVVDEGLSRVISFPTSIDLESGSSIPSLPFRASGDNYYRYLHFISLSLVKTYLFPEMWV
jgi:hypothetical protein